MNFKNSLLGLFSLILVLLFCTPVYADESIIDLKEFENLKNLKEEDLITINNAFLSIGITEITESSTENTEANTIYLIKTNKLPIKVYYKEEILEKITVDISNIDILEEKELILYEGDLKDIKEKVNILSEYNFLNDKNTKNAEDLEKSLSTSDKMTKLMFVGFGLAGIFVVIIFILIIKLNKASEISYMYNSLLKEYEDLSENFDKLTEKSKAIKKEEINSKEHINKLNKCIAKLNKDLTEQKLINENTLNNFSQMHEQDLISIGNSHQKEIAIIKEDYERKIKELEENNKGLQIAITKINKEQ